MLSREKVRTNPFLSQQDKVISEIELQLDVIESKIQKDMKILIKIPEKIKILIPITQQFLNMADQLYAEAIEDMKKIKSLMESLDKAFNDMILSNKVIFELLRGQERDIAQSIANRIFDVLERVQVALGLCNANLVHESLQEIMEIQIQEMINYSEQKVDINEENVLQKGQDEMEVEQDANIQQLDNTHNEEIELNTMHNGISSNQIPQNQNVINEEVGNVIQQDIQTPALQENQQLQARNQNNNLQQGEVRDTNVIGLSSFMNNNYIQDILSHQQEQNIINQQLIENLSRQQKGLQNTLQNQSYIQDKELNGFVIIDETGKEEQELFELL